jgi:hypothetical protein
VPATIDILDADIYTDVGAFIVATLGCAVIQGYPNRTAMPPAGAGFVEITITRKMRLSTNIDTWDTTNPSPTGTTQETHWQVTMQADCYGPASSAWATILAGLFRDEVACDALADTCQPLYADDPMRAPLTNAEEQYEDKWIVPLQLQYNPTISTAQQFANALTVGLIEVDEAYPP